MSRIERIRSAKASVASLAVCCLAVWQCGEDRDVPHDAAPDDGSTDSGFDAGSGADAAADSGPPSRCDPPYRETPQAWVEAEGVHLANVEYELVVVASTETGFRAVEDPKLDEREQNYIEVGFPEPFDASYRLPIVGETLLVLGGPCNLNNAYLRVMDLDRNILWEGGSASCGDMGQFRGPYLGVRAIPGAVPCSDEVWSCLFTRLPLDTIVHPDGDSVLLPGEKREVEIDGARFMGVNYGEFVVADWPAGCPTESDLAWGSAFLVRLAD